jgi:V8-like Glu-specific endopeptidase
VLDDDWGSGDGKSRTTNRPAEADTEFITIEVAGDASAGESDKEAGANEEVSPEGGSAGEFTEATPEQLAAEAGEESAVSDLRGIEGFEESTYTESESSAGEFGLTEAGAVAAGDSAEFLPILAALVPTLVSSVGPMIAKGIASKLSPKAKRAIGKIAGPRPGGVAPGSTGALLAQIAQLLKTLQSRPGGESGMEATDETVAIEAAAVLEVILGTDDRIRISNTTAVPWRRICALRITFPTGAVYRGTGFLIGPRTLATAGHCVYLHGQGGWARKVEVIPGGTDGSTRPFGSAESSQFRSVAGWVTGKKPESDYGCIVLPTGSFNGRNLGSFAVGALSAADLVAKPAVLAGYPGDKPFAQLWGMARKIKTVSATTLTYDIDSMGGQSGAPLYIQRNGSRTVVGIHNYGASSGNSATRVTQGVAQRLIAWSKL